MGGHLRQGMSICQVLLSRKIDSIVLLITTQCIPPYNFDITCAHAPRTAEMVPLAACLFIFFNTVLLLLHRSASPLRAVRRADGFCGGGVARCSVV